MNRLFGYALVAGICLLSVPPAGAVPAAKDAPRTANTLELVVAAPSTSQAIYPSSTFAVTIINHSPSSLSFSTSRPYGLRVLLYDSRGKPLSDIDYYSRDRLTYANLTDVQTLAPGESRQLQITLFPLKRPLGPGEPHQFYPPSKKPLAAGRYIAKALLPSLSPELFSPADRRAIRQKHVTLWQGDMLESKPVVFDIRN